MFLTILLMLSALGLSSIAGYYSVAGMTAIFAASWWPIVIMTGTLEFSKVILASWLYRNWQKSPVFLKTYFTIAIIILMFITSLGIFGYLSKAHIDQIAGVSDNPLLIKQIEQQISTEQARIDDSRKVIIQMDGAVTSMLSQSITEGTLKAGRGSSIAKQATTLRSNQKKDRDTLNKLIDESNSKIQTLNKEKLKLEQEQIKIEAEVGPIKYIAQMIYGDNPDKMLLEKAVRYVIIMIIAVFDPLAILMIIAANMSLKTIKEEKEENQKKTVKEQLSTKEENQIYSFLDSATPNIDSTIIEKKDSDPLITETVIEPEIVQEITIEPEHTAENLEISVTEVPEPTEYIFDDLDYYNQPTDESSVDYNDILEQQLDYTPPYVPEPEIIETTDLDVALTSASPVSYVDSYYSPEPDRTHSVTIIPVDILDPEQLEIDDEEVTLDIEPSINNLQSTIRPANIKRPDDMLNTIKKYHNVRLDDARSTLKS